MEESNSRKGSMTTRINRAEPTLSAMKCYHKSDYEEESSHHIPWLEHMLLDLKGPDQANG